MTIYIYFFVKDDKQRRKRKATERKNYKRGKEEHLNQNRAKTRRETLLYRIRVRACEPSDPRLFLSPLFLKLGWYRQQLSQINSGTDFVRLAII